jgi:DNA replication protein DnaC
MAHSPENFASQIVSRLAPGAPLTAPLGEREAVCSSHGPYTATGTRYMGKREIWTGCPDCKEAELAAERQAEAKKQAEQAQRVIEAMLEEAAIPKRFMGRTLDNFKASNSKQSAALSIAREFASNFEIHRKKGTGLIFSGLPGTGKSHLATAILQAIMPDHCGVYVTCMQMIQAVRATWRKDSEKTEVQVLKTFGAVPLLVLDEVGVQYGTDGEKNLIFEVLDRRYRDMLPTIILTNENTEGLKALVGERSFDRLTESCRWVSFDWGSYRQTAKKEAAL